MDDFREAYYWLRQNTKEDATVSSASFLLIVDFLLRRCVFAVFSLSGRWRQYRHS